jgi:putative FmdB family regulatory protein
MPTYEYACKGCGSHIEVVQSFSEDSLTTCESCGGDLRKVFGSIGISFKGSGFYKTDSRGGSGQKPAASTGTEAKPESPLASKPAPSSGDKSGSASKADTSSSSSSKSDSGSGAKAS